MSRPRKASAKKTAGKSAPDLFANDVAPPAEPHRYPPLPDWFSPECAPTGRIPHRHPRSSMILAYRLAAGLVAGEYALPTWQRAPVWTMAQRIAFLDSMVRRIPTPDPQGSAVNRHPLAAPLAPCVEARPRPWLVVDGQQRLTILAHLHPHAIPAPHRQRPRVRPPKDFVLYDQPIAAPVLEALYEGTVDDREFTFHFRAEGAVLDAARQVLVALGGIPERRRGQTVYSFIYRPYEVLREVIANGVIPDQWSHQFYPTPRDIAEDVAAAAGIEPGHRVLEPSAGQGHLARALPPGATLVEVSELHCKILRAAGFPGATVHCADFLAWRDGLFDRIVMNPPFSEGRAVRHLEHAASMTAPGGRIVAVLPAGLANKDLLPGWTLTWGERRPFPGTSIEVVILVADRGES